MDDELNSIYTDTNDPASYSASVSAFIQTKRSLSVHKRKLKNFKRRKWIVPGPYQTICADLIDYQQYFRINSGFKYILVVIDAFSRMAYTKALKSKTALEVAMAMSGVDGERSEEETELLSLLTHKVLARELTASRVELPAAS